MTRINFKRSSYDSCAYINTTYYTSIVFLLLYVDDMLVASKFKEDLKKLKDSLKDQFDMKDLGE